MYKQSEISMLITDKTKLIMFVDYFGVETQLESSLQEQLENQDIIVVKDRRTLFYLLRVGVFIRIITMII